MTGWLLIPFALLLLTGAPIAFALVLAAFSFLSAWGTISFDVIAQKMFGGDRLLSFDGHSLFHPGR